MLEPPSFDLSASSPSALRAVERPPVSLPEVLRPPDSWHVQGSGGRHVFGAPPRDERSRGPPGTRAVYSPALLVALSTDLPLTQPPGVTEAFVWSMLLPMVPVVLLGQVWLYRMTRRPAAETTFFA